MITLTDDDYQILARQTGMPRRIFPPAPPTLPRATVRHCDRELLLRRRDPLETLQPFE